MRVAGSGNRRGADPLTTGQSPRRSTREQRRDAAAARAKADEARQRQRRRALLLVGVLAALLIAGGLTALALTRRPAPTTTAAGPQIIPATPAGPVTVQGPVTGVPDHSGIPGVRAWNTGDWPGAGTSTTAGILAHDHVPGPVTYSITPPVGGPHNPVWMNAGAYTQPIPAERAVHNLEHGAVWIVYRPDLPRSEVDALTGFVTRQSLIDESAGTRIPGQKNRYIDLSPWTGDNLPAPIVISAWGHQLRVTNPGDPRLQQFVDMFRNSRTYAPESGSPVDGIPVQTGGRPAADGATQANPPGSAGAGAGTPGN